MVKFEQIMSLLKKMSDGTPTLIAFANFYKKQRFPFGGGDYWDARISQSFSNKVVTLPHGLASDGKTVINTGIVLTSSYVIGCM